MLVARSSKVNRTTPSPFVGRGGEGVGERILTSETSHRKRARTRRRPLRRLLRAVLWLLAAVVALPLVLTPLYWVVEPVSVPMLERYVTGQPVVREWRRLDDISDRLKRRW